MTALVNWILDTIHGWFHKDNSPVYLAGIEYGNSGKYVLIKMVPENDSMGDGWQVLTEVMPKYQATQRILSFQLVAVVAQGEQVGNRIEIGT